MSISKNLKSMNTSAKLLHGNDISILVAKAVAFGDKENLVMISGVNHKEAALDFSKAVPFATLEEVIHPEMFWGGETSPAYTTTNIRW